MVGDLRGRLPRAISLPAQPWQAASPPLSCALGTKGALWGVKLPPHLGSSFSGISEVPAALQKKLELTVSGRRMQDPISTASCQYRWGTQASERESDCPQTNSKKASMPQLETQVPCSSTEHSLYHTTLQDDSSSWGRRTHQCRWD